LPFSVKKPESLEFNGQRTLTVANLTRILRSRDSWKKTAIDRRKALEVDRKRIARLTAKLSKANEEIDMQRTRLAIVEKGGARMRQSEIASLRPPKLRSKGRYQSISKVIEWAAEMAWLMGGGGRAVPGSLAGALRKALPGLAQMKSFFARFNRDCKALNAFLEVLKSEGINSETAERAKEKLKKLPKGNRLRKDLERWLSKHLAIQRSLVLGDTPLLVSSDIIETLMGMLKLVIERMPTPEFSTMTLATPLFCGPVNAQSIQEALTSCSHSALVDWRSSNCNHTHRKRRTELFMLQAVPDVQKTRSRRAA
jgi:hypothetical protein